MSRDLADVASHFALYGNFVIAAPYGTGHINDTYLAVFDQGGTLVRYIIQRINHNIFRDPVRLMENFTRVTAHIGKKLDEERRRNPVTRRRTLQVVPTYGGESCYRDAEGNFYRCYVFVENARTYDILETPEQAFQAAAAFGGFQADLADLEGRLTETIPAFHHANSRLSALEAAAKEDRAGRLKEVRQELDFILARREDCGLFLSLLARGELTERVTHNDCKLNNVLIDDLTGSGCCVIDLDTVMPGLPHYDFGDMVRTGTSPVAEDETDLTKVTMRFPMFEALLRGYLSTAGSFLTPLEKSLLPFSGKLITLVIGIRFLTDYLQGDVYFKIKRPGHNLDRCRTQLKLIESIESQLDAMKKLTETL